MQRKLILDVREACHPNRTGKGQWTYGLVTEFLRQSVPVLLLTNRPLPPEWLQFQPTFTIIRAKGFLWHLAALWWLRSQDATFYFSSTSAIVPAYAPRNVTVVPVIHDLIAFQSDPHDRRARLIERLTVPRALRRAAWICTVSETTKQDLLARFPHLSSDRMTTIYAGPHDPESERSSPDGRTILCVATLCPRKNQLRLVQAFAQLPDAIRQQSRLVLAGGRGWNDQEILDLIRSTPNTEWIGYVDDDAYRTLLQSCTLFAFPSLYEGFGIPVLDALQRGVPVLTSNRGSLQEIAEGAALIVNPEDVGSIASGLEQLLTNDARRAELSEAGIARASQYSWAKTADRVLQVLNKL